MMYVSDSTPLVVLIATTTGGIRLLEVDRYHTNHTSLIATPADKIDILYSKDEILFLSGSGYKTYKYV